MSGGAANKPSRKYLWEIKFSDNHVHSQYTDLVDYRANLRRRFENAAGKTELAALWQAKEPVLAVLKQKCLKLESEKGKHYVDILRDLYTARAGAFE